MPRAYKLDKGVPIPKKARPKGEPTIALRLLVEQGKVGDSVFIDNYKCRELWGRVRKLGLNGKITMRTTQKGVRVWKIEE